MLILDNADDLLPFGVVKAGKTTNDVQSSTLIEYIPRAPTGTVLWTSRDERIIGTLISSRRGIKVGPMERDESIELLEAARNAEMQDEQREATELLEELQQLPLAISQAGAYMRRTLIPIQEYLTMLRQGTQRWQVLQKTETDRHRRPEVSNSVLETWVISMDRIRQESKIACRILSVVA